MGDPVLHCGHHVVMNLTVHWRKIGKWILFNKYYRYCWQRKKIKGGDEKEGRPQQ
ncbi:MAG: hypothetical protein JRF02_01675 [Deltaproteobacteria bacterium]|jgi:hypothetical protein|nr:hypothetical protein [Deltaproteobacteria bacterium]